jgi:hypothetical protein
MKMMFLVAAIALSGCVAKNDSPQPASSHQPGALVIAYSADSSDTFTANRTDSVLALDWLREIASSHQIAFEAKTYPYGTLVERIGYRQNGEGGYWLYKVNGQMVPKSADAHRVAWSDTLTFFFDER